MTQVLEYAQAVLSTSSVATLEVPDGTRFADLQATGNNIRYTLDGQNPTTSFGMLMLNGAPPIRLASNLLNFKAIAASGSPRLNVQFHG